MVEKKHDELNEEELEQAAGGARPRRASAPGEGGTVIADPEPAPGGGGGGGVGPGVSFGDPVQTDPPASQWPH